MPAGIQAPGGPESQENTLSRSGCTSSCAWCSTTCCLTSAFSPRKKCSCCCELQLGRRRWNVCRPASTMRDTSAASCGTIGVGVDMTMSFISLVACKWVGSLAARQRRECRQAPAMRHRTMRHYRGQLLCTTIYFVSRAAVTLTYVALTRGRRVGHRACIVVFFADECNSKIHSIFRTAACDFQLTIPPRGHVHRLWQSVHARALWSALAPIDSGASIA